MTSFHEYANEVVDDFLWLGSEDAGKAPLPELKELGITHVLVPAFTGLQPVVYPDQLHYLHLNLRDVKGE